MNTLMLTHVVSCLPTARHMSLMCSSGPQGYDALKEMMHNGMPGRILLLESDDLYNVGGSASSSDHCCLLYAVNIANKHDISINDCSRSLPSTVTHLNVYWNIPSSPPSELLYNCFSLTSISLRPLVPITSLQHTFLAECNELVSIDLSPLSEVTAIDSSFLEGCSSLASIDLTPLSNIVEVPDSFLAVCSELKEIDLSPLSQVTVVGAFFMCGCAGLTDVDLQGLSRVTSIGLSFLSGCSGLTSIDLRPLSRVQMIADGFLSDCSSLKVIDMTPLVSLEQLPYDGLRGASPNVEVTLPRSLCPK